MDIKDRYTLGPDKIDYSILKNFPRADRVGIFLSGGMESTLMALIAFNVYGKDKVLCFYSDSMFSSNREDGNKHIQTNIDRAAKLLDVEPIYVPVDYEQFVSDRQQAIVDNVNNIKTKYQTDVLMFGFTSLFFEVEPFRQHGLTKQDILDKAFANPVQYKRTIEEFHLETDAYTEHLLTIDIAPEAYSMLKDKSIVVCPFDTLNKSEVVDLYRQTGLIDYLFQTSSCVVGEITATGKHCGHCFNCQQRYDSFRILGGVTDLTEYASDEIHKRRQALEHLHENRNPKKYTQKYTR